MLFLRRIMPLIRPPDIVVGRLRFYRDSSSSSVFFHQLPYEVAERNSPKTGHMLGSEYNLKMVVRNLEYPFPLQIQGPKATFLDDFATQQQL